MASGGKRQNGPAHRRAAQGSAKRPAEQRAPSVKSGSGAPKNATTTASSANTGTRGGGTATKSSAPVASGPRPAGTAVATRPAPRPTGGTNGAARTATQTTYRSRMNQRKRVRQQQRRILGTVAAVLVVGGLGWLLISHLPSHAAGSGKVKTAKPAATAHVTPAATSAPAATATPLVCAPVSVLGLNGTPTKPNGPPAITGTLVNGAQCLQYVDIKPGSGPAIKAGDNVTVNYTGWLSTGQQFDTSIGAGKSPFTVQNVGQAGVITGWNLGLIGMKAGGERRLIIPPALGYGAGGYPPAIPGDETLIFDITVVSIG